MKNTILTFAAVVMSCMLPFSVTASENGERSVTDNYEALTNTIENPTTAFITLDDNASTELVQMHFNNSGSSALIGEIIDYASKFLGRPYRRGGKGPSGFDCSGFTSFVFRNFDISLSPSSRDQFTQGERISRGEIQPGDLLFFAGRRGGKTVGHVAMAVSVDENGTVKFIHAANGGGIRHDTYPDGGYYSNRYLGARRVINQ